MYQPPQVIAEKLLDFLRTASDDGQKAEVAKRIGELAERFAPDTQWFIDTMNQAGSARWSGVQQEYCLPNNWFVGQAPGPNNPKVLS